MRIRNPALKNFLQQIMNFCTWQNIAFESKVLSLLELEPGVADGDDVWHDLDPCPSFQAPALNYHTTSEQLKKVIKQFSATTNRTLLHFRTILKLRKLYILVKISTPAVISKP